MGLGEREQAQAGPPGRRRVAGGDTAYGSRGGDPEESWTRAWNGGLVPLQQGNRPTAFKEPGESGTGTLIPPRQARRVRFGQTHGRK